MKFFLTLEVTNSEMFVFRVKIVSVLAFCFLTTNLFSQNLITPTGITGTFFSGTSTKCIDNSGLSAIPTTVAGAVAVTHISPASISDATDNSDSLLIGNSSSYTSPNMRLGCFSVYNKSLTDAQILQNYNALKARFGL